MEVNKFQVGDLIRFKASPHGRLAVVISCDAFMFGRIMVQFMDSQRPEMANPGSWEVVSTA